MNARGPSQMAIDNRQVLAQSVELVKTLLNADPFIEG
jgi:hypothetical protein